MTLIIIMGWWMKMNSISLELIYYYTFEVLILIKPSIVFLFIVSEKAGCQHARERLP